MLAYALQGGPAAFFLIFLLNLGITLGVSNNSQIVPRAQMMVHKRINQQAIVINLETVVGGSMIYQIHQAEAFSL